jgi:hypothetical protein
MLVSSDSNSPIWADITDNCGEEPDSSEGRVCNDTRNDRQVYFTSGGAILRIGRSTSFGLSTTPAVFEEFSVTGFWTEYDDNRPDVTQVFPDFSQETSGSVPGDTVVLGSRRLEIPFLDDFKFSYTAR